MLENVDICRLITPVVQRASADVSAKMQGFSDRSAIFVLQQLGVNSVSGATKYSDSIARCAWIDRQLRHYFYRYPKAEGIEVANGLSTRFHRLCERADWPRFSWRAINTCDINDYCVRVFPGMDNHQCVGDMCPQKNWEKYIDWYNEKPKILIIGECDPLRSAAEFIEIYNKIQGALTPKSPTIDVILSHHIAQFFSCETTSSTPFEIVSEQPTRDKKNWLHTIFSAFRGDLFYGRHVSTHHLRITLKTAPESHKSVMAINAPAFQTINRPNYLVE